MNRRQLLQLVLGATCLTEAAADCRDDRGMIMPAYDRECHDLNVTYHTGLVTGRQIKLARGWFGFDCYEELLALSKNKGLYEFVFDDQRWKIKVSRLSVDVNRAIGCVVCEVEGGIYYA